MKKKFQIFALSILIISLGCGGNPLMKPTSDGSLRLSIVWPTTREIPTATKSVKVVVMTLVKDGNGETIEDLNVAEQVVARPQGTTTSSINLTHLPSVKVRVKITAHSSTDGSGVPLASGSKDVDIAADTNTSISIALSTTVTAIEATPASLSITPGLSATLTAEAKDSTGAIMTIADSRWSFASNDTAVATVVKRITPNGHIADVTAVTAGTTTITVKDTQTGLTQTVPVTIGTFDCCEYSCRNRSTSASGPNSVSVSGAYAIQGGVFVTLYNTGTAEARSKEVFVVNAPTISGSFSANVHFKPLIEDETHDNADKSASLTLTYPGGTSTFSTMGQSDDRTFTISLHHGMTFSLVGTVNAQAGADAGVSASSVFYVGELPNGATIERVSCTT